MKNHKGTDDIFKKLSLKLLLPTYKKYYLRIIIIKEVQRMLVEDKNISLISITCHCRYFDQAHFINDFRSITGQKPTILIKERNRFISNPGFSIIMISECEPIEIELLLINISQ